MPTYEYECLECQHKFDVFQSIKDQPIKKCEKCSGKVRKLFGNAGIIFKGSGFYVNDYKKQKPADSSKNKKEVKPEASCSNPNSSATCESCKLTK